MKILILTQVLPYPPDSGPKVKTWNVVKYLAQHHQVTLVSYVRGDQSAAIRQLQAYCKEVHTVSIRRGFLVDLWYLLLSLLTGQPFLMVRDNQRAMRDLVDRLASRTSFDVVHADQLNMAQFARRMTTARKLLDAHNALWLLYERLWRTMRFGPKKWLLGREWRLLKRYEGEISREFDAVLAVSGLDKLALEEAAGQSLNVTVIPIAIDTDETSPIARRPDADHILHIGTMFWPPNIDGILWFLDEVYPLIRQIRPHVVFDVIGANPPREIMAYGESDPGIHVTGYVEDPGPYLEHAGVIVVPLRAGGGMRVKILNALGQGLPVVSTSLGCEGIAVVPGHHLLVADEPKDFARAVVQLLDDRELADCLGRNGRRLIERVHDYRIACCKMEIAYGNGAQTTSY